jgi:hypothetical protein
MQRGRSFQLQGGTYKRSLWVVRHSGESQNPVLLLEAGSWLLEAVSQKQTQFFHDQNIDIASKTQKRRPKS